MQDLHQTSKIAHEFQYGKKIAGSFDNLVEEDRSTTKSIFEILSKIDWEQLN